MQQFKRGTNFSHWLRSSAEEVLPVMCYDEFAQVAAWGADHIRLPVEYALI